MKKIISFLAGALMLTSTTAWADSYVAENKADFVSAWNALGKNPRQQDTIFVAADMGGLNMNTTNGPLAGALYIIGQEDETGKMPRLEVQIAIDTCVANSFSLIFEDLTLSRRSTGTGEIVASRTAPTYIDTLAFRNCDILEFGRWPYRSTCSGGNINYFEVTDCSIHNADGEQEMFRFSQSIVEAVIVNNTFYNLHLHAYFCRL